MSNQLFISDLQVGDGKAVVKGALITAHYRGFLDDGTPFDSSYDLVFEIDLLEVLTRDD